MTEPDLSHEYMLSLYAYHAPHAPYTQALPLPCPSPPNSLQADGERLKMRFSAKDQNNAIAAVAAAETGKKEAVAGLVNGSTRPRNSNGDVVPVQGDKHVAWGQVGSTSRPLDIARDSIEEKEGDKHVAGGMVGSTSRPRDIARDSIEEKEGDKQGAEADLVEGSADRHGDKNRSLRGTH